MYDNRVNKCPACHTQRLRRREKQVNAKNVKEILQRTDAAEYLELQEEEEKLFEEIRDLNSSIESVSKRGNVEVKALLEKELADVRKKLKKTNVEKAEEVKALSATYEAEG